MEKLNVLLVCGSGASSGFMAVNIRKEAARRGIECTVTARSEIEIESYLGEINCLMVGPHLTYLVEEVKGKIKGCDIKVALMKKTYYSVLDGKKALDHILSLFEE